MKFVLFLFLVLFASPKKKPLLSGTKDQTKYEFLIVEGFIRTLKIEHCVLSIFKMFNIQPSMFNAQIFADEAFVL